MPEPSAAPPGRAPAIFATPLHWVAGIEPHRLALSARPRGGEDLGDSFPIRDRSHPDSPRALGSLLAELHKRLRAGEAVAIHCRAGIGRTGLVAGCLLHRLGVAPDDVFHLLSRSRGIAVPDTEAQMRWVERFVRPA